MSKTVIVSRYPAAISFARSELERAGLLSGEPEVLPHLDESTLSQLGEGDIVAGVLPLPIVARLLGAGVRVFLISLNLPPEARGRELSIEEMRSYGACLLEVKGVIKLTPLDEVMDKKRKILLRLAAEWIQRARGKSSRSGFYLCLEEALACLQEAGEEALTRELERTEYSHQAPAVRVLHTISEMLGGYEPSGTMPEIEGLTAELKEVI